MSAGLVWHAVAGSPSHLGLDLELGATVEGKLESMVEEAVLPEGHLILGSANSSWDKKQA